MSRFTRRHALAMLAPPTQHERFMRRAIELAANVPAFPFGALLVDPENNIVAEGFNKSPLNPTFHGEIDAINTCAIKNPNID